MDKSLRYLKITSLSEFILPEIQLKFSNDLMCEFINEKENNLLLSYKNKIDDIKSQKLWDKSKKLSNDYELIHLPGKKIKYDSRIFSEYILIDVISVLTY